MTTNPVLLEVTRNGRVESQHRGAIAIVDSEGRRVAAIGEVGTPVYPRSAVKAIQALPLVESGAAKAYEFGQDELSLACSSHSAEQAHVDLATDMLRRTGQSEAALECGGHWSFVHHVKLQQARKFDKTPGAISNNCSGKHIGFISTAVHQLIDPAGYIKPEHEVQRQVKAALEDLVGTVYSEARCGTDGCSIPTYATSLTALAQGFARMATGTGLDTERAAAAKHILQACMDSPFHMAGSKRFCTRIMEALPGRIFAKTGAEGVYCGAIPELGLGIALKCDDGATRAAEIIMGNVAFKLLNKEPLAVFTQKPVSTWNRVTVGEIRAAEALRHLVLSA